MTVISINYTVHHPNGGTDIVWQSLRRSLGQLFDFIHLSAKEGKRSDRGECQNVPPANWLPLEFISFLLRLSSLFSKKRTALGAGLDCGGNFSSR